MSSLYSTKKSRVGGLQLDLGALECPHYLYASLVSVLKVSPLPSPLKGRLKPARKEKT